MRDFFVRRGFLLGAAAALTLPAEARNTLAEVLRAGPRPKLIKGNKFKGIPDKVDFGHGLLVPVGKDTFHALWEGDDRWLAYGHGVGHNRAAAMGLAEEAAIGTMKLYLLTLAFAPDRLMRIEGGGWRLKSGNTADLVHGNIALPGRPVMPAVDEMNSDNNDVAGGLEATHASTGWLIWKRDVTLDSVRAKAILVPAGL